ncbi:Huntingtin interacting protein 1 [Strongyloides ratti]|uniref:Huntingtin interacting protein 1 n=1 Tax=Strongyloides ratti TaxID=34506 RepID=A0A090LGK3_STRRB|nr:Huntingtin interacting protein 1 [Strongyloides ratti]CEF66645.1 Huntingtin interacting protein 1 [Strongyloides ratti]
MSRSALNTNDREAFLKSQLVAIHKALNKVEAPLKQKHARALTIGTHKERSAAFFWSAVSRIQLEKHPVLTWKFCHLLHKLIRDGHRQVLNDSYRYTHRIQQLSAFWQHLKTSGFGKCNNAYCSMLNSRLNFHKRHHIFPGNLNLTENQLNSLLGGDINEPFELAVEMLDEMDCLMNFQSTVYEAIEVLRVSSLVPSGQCLLAPLILVVLDSSKFYDYLVKIIFKLHSSLPADVLAGHRERFNGLFKKVKKFYEDAGKMQYFKYLVSVPQIPSSPPDFLVASDLNSYQTPHAYLHGEEGHDESSNHDTMSIADEGTILDLNFDDTSSVTESNTSTMNPSDINSIFNSLPPVSAPDEKDTTIANLRNELETAKVNQNRIINEAKLRFDQYENRVMQLQSEIDFHKQSADEVKDELERVKSIAQETQNKVKSTNQEEYEKKIQSQEQKFNKMKDIYGKLREEHIKTLTDIKNLNTRVFELEEASAKKEEKIASNNTTVDELNDHLARSELEIENLKRLLSEKEAEKKVCENELQRKKKEEIDELFKKVCSGGIEILTNNNDNLGNATSITYPTHLVLEQYDYLINLMDELKKNLSDENPNIGNIVHSLNNISHIMANTLANTVSAAYTTSIESFEPVNENYATAQLDNVLSSYKDLKIQCEKLPSLTMDISEEEIGSQFEEEMARMDEAIKAAVEAMQALQQKSRQNHTGLRLEVNDNILDACNELMAAIQILIIKSRDVQQEIVQASGGNSNPREFYKKNHQWTDGLLSAAQAVGVTARVLVASADNAIVGSGKFEQLIVAATELAASIAQLSVASRVKSNKNSTKLAELGAAVKTVNKCTANVVATTKNGQKSLNDDKLLDFTHLSLHEAKKEEMESQVRTLELEAELSRERNKLSQLRKQHYHLASLVSAENNNS